MIYYVNDFSQEDILVGEYSDEQLAIAHKKRLTDQGKLADILPIREAHDPVEPEPEIWTKVEHFDIAGNDINVITDMIVLGDKSGETSHGGFFSPMNEVAQSLRDSIGFGDNVEVERVHGYQWKLGDDPNFEEDDDKRVFLDLVFKITAHEDSAYFVQIV